MGNRINKKWTAREIQYMRERWPRQCCTQIADGLQVEVRFVVAALRRFGISGNKRPRLPKEFQEHFDAIRDTYNI